jgi:hypothetical protein
MLLGKLKVSEYSRRWYDQDRGCARLILLIHEIKNPSLNQAACKMLKNFSAKVNQEIAYRTNDPSQLGLAGIRDRYLKGTHSRRRYDRKSDLRSAVQELYLLPPQGLTAVGFQLNQTMEMLVVYSFALDKLEAQPDPKEVLNIMRVGLHEGMEAAQETLAECIGSDLFKELTRTYKG